jgi:hypothetical protein
MDIGNFLTVAPSQCIDQWWRASWSSLIWEFHAERGVCFILQKEGVTVPPASFGTQGVLHAQFHIRPPIGAINQKR